MPLPRSLTTAPHADLELEVVAGRWPDDISGEVLYSSPQISGSLPYGIFDWGAICRLSLTPGTRGAGSGRFSWQARSIQTPGKRLYDRFPDRFGPGATGYTSPFGTPNAANTAPLPWGDRLYATWDAGRPVELHPDTLEFVAEVGHIDSWGGSSLPTPGVLPFLFSSAHPVADPERDCLWTVKLDPVFEPTFGMRPSVVRYDRADGTAVRRWPLDGVAFDGAIHTVSQTRDWVILADSGNFKADPAEVMGGERTVTVDDDAPLWLVRKDQLESLPSGTPVTPIPLRVRPPAGHYYARWDDSEGIQIVWEGMDLMDLGLYLRPGDVDVLGNAVDPALVGLYGMAMAPETLVEVVIDPVTGRVTDQARVREDWTVNLQLSAMDWSLEGQTAPTLHHVAYQGGRPETITERAAALYAGRIDLDRARRETPGALCSFERGSLELRSRWEYPDLADLISSPAFAPRGAGTDPGASRYAGTSPGGHDGYVVLPVCNDDGFRVELFDAADVGAGPVAVLAGTGRECIPLILHAAWSPGADRLADAARLRFADELDADRVSSVPEELQGALWEVAEECDALAGSAQVG